MRQLSEGLAANQAAFIRAGTFLLMEKLRQAVYRRLLKRVWLLHRKSDPDKAHQLPLGALCRCLKITRQSGGRALSIEQAEAPGDQPPDLRLHARALLYS